MTKSEQEKRLRELIHEDFIWTLKEVAKVGGWTMSTDYTEVAEFIDNLVDFMGFDKTNLEPYEIED